MCGLVRTIIADDQRHHSEGLKQLCRPWNELTVNEKRRYVEAVHRLLNESSAIFLILSLGMPGVSGFFSSY